MLRLIKYRPALLFLILFILVISGCSANENISKDFTISQGATGNNISEKLLSKNGSFSEINPGLKELKVHFLDVGQADSILIQAPSGTILIDGGNNDDAGLIVQYLKAQGVKRIDAVIATHPHEDHIGGLDVVIRSFPVSSIYIPKAVTTTRTFEDFINAVKASGAKRIQAKANTKLDVPGLDGVFLAPRSEKYEDLNNYSTVLKILMAKDLSYLSAMRKKNRNLKC